MISRDELHEAARAFDLHEANVQRDYVFGWLLSGIFRETSIADLLTLKGGNALRKGYLPSTRFSDDLDLSTAASLDAEQVLAELNRVCEYVQSHAGVQFDMERNRLTGEQQIDRDKRAFKFRLYFTDFLGPKEITISVRVDLTEFDRLLLPAQERSLIHPYSDSDECSTTIRCVKFEEIIADKLRCLLQRRYCYDLFDVVYATFLAREVEVDRAEVMNVFLRKTIFGGSPHAAKMLLLDLPLDLFRGFWGKVVCPAESRFGFEAAVSTLTSGIEQLFGLQAPGANVAGHFFPSRLRNPILAAGSDHKLLRIRYDGVTRTVEPYSLVFKRRKDGVAFEYLYVFDRTGGLRSGPGIKSLVQHKVEALELTDEPFEPRFAVELAKAGGIEKSGNFERAAPTSLHVGSASNPNWKACGTAVRADVHRRIRGVREAIRASDSLNEDEKAQQHVGRTLSWEVRSLRRDSVVTLVAP